MIYEAQNFDHLLGLAGFSDTLLKNHFTLYQGYVANTNKLLALQEEMQKSDRLDVPEFAEINRRFGWEFNGMRLHELYFSNLTVDAGAIEATGALATAMASEFGSVGDWEKNFRAKCAFRGIGWVILALDTHSGRLFNVWVNEHDVGHLAGATPILVFDAFEHAYMIDYGIKKAEYINSFFRAINWREVEGRMK
ncbi:MAG: Fe-Mn family superoxide dismutase [Patescibacteria group bacterium]